MGKLDDNAALHAGHERKASGRLAVYAICAAAGVAIGILLGWRDVKIDTDALLGVCIALLLGVRLSVVIHEAGHLALGMLTGLRFCSFRVGALVFMRAGDGLRVRQMKLPGTAGQCIMRPPERYEDMKSLVPYNMGGALFNLLAGGAVDTCAALAVMPAWLYAALRAFAFLNYFMAIANLVPLSRLGNDGCNVIRALREPEYGYDMWRQLRVEELECAGLRPAQMPPELFDAQGRGTEEERLRYALALALDTHRFDEARGLAGRFLALGGVTPLKRNLVQEEALFLELTGENRGDEVGRLRTPQLDKYMRAATGMMASQRVLYALAVLRDGDADAAARYKARFEKLARAWPHEGDAALERELMALTDERERGPGA